MHCFTRLINRHYAKILGTTSQKVMHTFAFPSLSLPNQNHVDTFLIIQHNPRRLCCGHNTPPSLRNNLDHDTPTLYLKTR